MDTRFLSTLLAVAETGSFAQAARQQHITAATVAQRVRALENDLKIKLVTRAGQTVLPTDGCRALLPRIRRMLHDAAQLQGDADSSGLSGRFRLGAISTVLADNVPAIVHRFATQAPEADLKIQPGTSAQLYEAVCASQLDMAIIVAPPFVLPKRLRTHLIAEQPFVVIVPTSDRPRAIPELFGTNPVLVYERAAWGGQVAWKMLQSFGVPLDIRCELDALETIASLVTRGMGVSLVPHWDGLNDYDGITAIPVSGPTRKIVAVFATMPERPKLVDLCLTQEGR